MPVSTPAGVLAVLSGVCAIFFWLERRTQWRLFEFLPPLIFIYLVPVLLSNAALLPFFKTGVLPLNSPVYDAMRDLLLPMMLVLLLLNVNIGGAFRVMGKGLIVMLFGTFGVVIGAPIGFLAVRQWLEPGAWRAFGVLAGSWIGGTGNMSAVGEMIGANSTEFGLAVLGDSTIYLIWLPILLASKRFARRFARFTRVDAGRVARMQHAARAIETESRLATTPDYLMLLFLALTATWAADGVAALLPEFLPYLSTSTWRILLITTIGIALSFTPCADVPGSFALGMALVYLYVARMGASAELAGVARQAIPFLCGSLIWIFIHGGCCLFGAWLLRVDVHTAAIASAANIGGAASATIVASYHERSLVPASILMALIGYALGNYAAYIAALLCQVVA